MLLNGHIWVAEVEERGREELERDRGGSVEGPTGSLCQREGLREGERGVIGSVEKIETMGNQKLRSTTSIDFPSLSSPYIFYRIVT